MFKEILTLVLTPAKVLQCPHVATTPLLQRLLLIIATFGTWTLVSVPAQPWGICYTLLAVNKFSRYKFVYGLKNLTSSLLQAVQRFVSDCRVTPKLLRTDFDHKIMGGKVAAFLLSQQIPIESSPPYRQHQNGLVESHWKTTVTIAHNWITSSLLPS